MKVRTIINAETSLQSMQINNVPYKVVRDIYKLKSLLAEETKIARTRQNEFLSSTGGVIQDAKTIVFPNAEKRMEYEMLVDELMDSEVDIDFVPVDLTQFTDNIIFRNTDVDMDALSAFIQFESE